MPDSQKSEENMVLTPIGDVKYNIIVAPENKDSSVATTIPNPTQQFAEFTQIEESKEEGRLNRAIKKYQIEQYNLGRLIAMLLFFGFILLYWFKFSCSCNRDILITLITFAPIAFIYFGYDIAKFWKKE
ncbi:hypothetical protein HYX00_03840 [Candidatus Woesearchaeota archaeon]|nr:hypothetical protein [Candidatus Woesearchaeota archaeon]